jgi:hypothetical protein
MKLRKCFAIVLMTVVLTASSGPVLAESGLPSQQDEATLSACGVAQGFAAGTIFAAAVSALTPGGQTAAAILGLTAVSLRVGISILC